MATKQALKRLTKEYKLIVENPPPYVTARPNEDNILEWHYVITGPPETPYEGGQYHGTLTFPSDYPYKPPAIRMVTPNGRFKENTRLCLSMSDYHPDLWNPGWSVSTILTGLLSFMTGDEATTGSITTSEQQKRVLAKRSMEYNTYKNRRFKAVFADIAEGNVKELARRKEEGVDDLELANEAARNADPVTEVAKEKVIALDDIKDPEDRIRAEEALRTQAAEDRRQENAGSNSKLYIGVAICLFLLGLFMK